MRNREFQEALELLPFGQRADGVTDAEHFFNCAVCGRPVDMRDLAGVFWHEDCARSALTPTDGGTK